MTTYIKTNGELYHHGIKGMRWGQRNGPPYPLSSQQKTPAEKKHKNAVQKYTDRYINTLKHPIKAYKALLQHPIKNNADIQLLKDLKDDYSNWKAKKSDAVGNIKSSEEKQSYRDNKNLYRSLAEAKKDELKSQRQHPVIKSILSDARYKENEEKFRNTPYDGPAEEYVPSLDPEVVEKSIKQFKEEMGRDYNDDDYQDYKILSYIKEDICDSEGYNEKADRINAAPNWDKAYDEYMATKSKIISDHLSGYDDKKVVIRGDSYLNTYKRAVTEILYDIEREEWWKSHEQKT